VHLLLLPASFPEIGGGQMKQLLSSDAWWVGMSADDDACALAKLALLG